jgi:hypothetical protein
LKYASDFSASVLSAACFLSSFSLLFIKKKAASLCACVQLSTPQPTAQFPRICFELWTIASICDHSRRTNLFLIMAYLFF